MATLARWLSISLASIALVACASQHAMPGANTERTREELAQALLDLADLTISRFEAAYLDAAFEGKDPRKLAVLAMTRNEVAMNVRAIALGDDPGRDLVDLHVWSRVAQVACRNRVHRAPATFLDNCEDTYGAVCERIQVLARKWIDSSKMARIDAAVDEFLSEHPDIVTATLLRLVDLEDRRNTLGLSREELEDLHDPDDMFAPVNEANRQIERTRITGQQMVWLLSRMPTAAGWELKAQMDLAVSGPPLSDALANLGRGAGELGRVPKSLGDLATTIEALSSRVGGSDGLRGVTRDAILLGGLIALTVIVAATVGALVVVHRMHHLRRRDR
jgi:hypothetical protein